MSNTTKRMARRRLPGPLLAAIAAAGFIVVTLCIAAYADRSLIDYKASYQTGEHTGMGSRAITNSLQRYDANHYATIVEQGYSGQNVAFFPLYPLLVRAVHGLGIDTPYALLVVSWTFTIILASLLYSWFRFELKRFAPTPLTAWHILGLVAIFPTSFFLTLGYSESLFIVLTVGALYAYRSGHYVLAGILAGLSTSCRVQGVIVVIYFLAEYLRAQRWHQYAALIPVMLAPLGLVAYMLYLLITVGDPFAFISSQKMWGRLGGNPIHNLIDSFTPVYLWFMPILCLGLWAVYKKFGAPLALYALLFITIPLSTGRLDSLNRYMLALPILILALALWSTTRPTWQTALYLASSVFMLAWGILLFFNGYWVA